MEEEEKTELQRLRAQMAASCPVLPNSKIIEMCQDYGIAYDIPDVNTYRLFSILASAERILMDKADH